MPVKTFCSSNKENVFAYSVTRCCSPERDPSRSSDFQPGGPGGTLHLTCNLNGMVKPAGILGKIPQTQTVNFVSALMILAKVMLQIILGCKTRPCLM